MAPQSNLLSFAVLVGALLTLPLRAEESELTVSVVPSKHVVEGSKPVTVELRPGARLKARLEQAADHEAVAGKLRLIIGGAVPRKRFDVGVRVFLNLPTANASTSIEVPEYVGSFAFGENAGGLQESRDFVLRPGITIRRLRHLRTIDLGKALSITLVGVPLRKNMGSADVSVEFGRVTLSAAE